MKPAALILFGKVPLPGRVKARLAASIGEADAALLSESFLRDAARTYATLARGRPPEGISLAVAADPFPHDFWSEVFSDPWRIEPQGDGDLGRRLDAAFQREFVLHERVVVLGSDHPALSLSELETFLGADNAILPTRDGGYAALSLTRTPKAGALFEEIAWSTPSVFEQTVERARKVSIGLQIFPPTYDVDRADDVELLVRDLAARDRRDPSFPRETWAQLERIRTGRRTAITR